MSSSNNLEQQIEKEFAKFEIFKSIKEFTNVANKCNKDLQQGDELIVEFKYLGLGYNSGLGGQDVANGLVLYFRSKEFEKPITILTLHADGNLHQRNEWDFFYKTTLEKRARGDKTPYSRSFL